MYEFSKNSGLNIKKILAHLGALITMSAWGTSFLSTKIMMVNGGLTPVEMFVYRFACAYIILLLLSFKKFFANNWKDELQFLICGICSGSLYFILENYALEYTKAGNVSLLASISPIFTTILIAVVFRTRIKTGVILGSIISFIGVACLILGNGESFEIRPLGDMLALGAALTWAVYTLIIKNLNPFYNTIFITRKLFFYGVLTAIPLLIFQDAPLRLWVIFDFQDPTFFFNFLFLVLVCSGLAFLTWNETMKVLGSVTANNYLYLQPLVTMIAAYFVLGEQIFLLGYIGCILIVGGLIYSDKSNLKGSSNRRVQ